MASRSFSRALRSSLSHQSTSPVIQRRTLISASKYTRTSLTAPLKPSIISPIQQTRGVKTIDFAGTKEVVYGDIPSKQIWVGCRMLMVLQNARIGREKNSRCDNSSIMTRQNPGQEKLALVWLSDGSDRIISKMIPSPSSATVHKDTVKV